MKADDIRGIIRMAKKNGVIKDRNELAQKTGYRLQTFNAKIMRSNFSDKELEQIACNCGVKFIPSHFKLEAGEDNLKMLTVDKMAESIGISRQRYYHLKGKGMSYEQIKQHCEDNAKHGNRIR